MRQIRRPNWALSGLIGLAALIACPNLAEAINPPRSGARADLELDRRAGIGPLRSARVQSARTPGAQVQARASLEAELGSDLVLSFDADTGVVAWALPAGHTQVAGANASPALAEQFAHAFLARHIDALAPGSAATDFALVSDVSSMGLRTLGFAQRHAGLEVIGGQLSLSFRADTLVAVRSQALPHVQLPTSASALRSSAELSDQARAWVSRDFAAGRLDRSRSVGPASAPAILPLIHADGRVEYREVVTVEVRLDGPLGHWRVWVDARTAQPLARRSLQHGAQLEFTTYARNPLGPRASFPAPYVEVEAGGQTLVSSTAGELALAQEELISFTPSGLYSSMINANGPVLTSETMLAPDASFSLDFGDEPEIDAQLSAYIHTQIVKDRIRSIDPGFSVVDLQTQITVNIDEVCNAFADENTINFFLAGGDCRNSALISDVVYHEYGHVAHILGLQPGVGIFDGAVSEGASDYLSATIVDDPRVGVGFFLDTDDPIRDIDPPNTEWSWPEDTGEVHDEGRIIAGTLWDLRAALIDKYAGNLGVVKTDAIWLGGIQRSSDMPSWYLEALITNDDDGDLQNGTPDACEISEAFGMHGLASPIGALLERNEELLPSGEVRITLAYEEGLELCPSNLTAEAQLLFRDPPGPGNSDPSVATIPMIEVAPGLLEAIIPAPPELSVTHYQIDFDWGNGSTVNLPENRADEWYELWVGETTEIWCADFEGANQDWATQGEWSFGAPAGLGGDPEEAFAGSSVAGISLGFPGTYSPATSSRLTSPEIDTSGFEVVRLQYQRWLNVEDGYWDQARINANDERAWINNSSLFEDIATVHHRDSEWRFQDVELTPFIGDDGGLRLSFTLDSDFGLEFGGWNIDSVCVVGHGVAPAPDPDPVDNACGDGVVQPPEQCDDGNIASGDGCSSGCLLEDFEPPPEPEPELGWDPSGRGCGCVVEEDPPAGSGGLALLGLLGLLGLRRRSQTEQA